MTISAPIKAGRVVECFEQSGIQPLLAIGTIVFYKTIEPVFQINLNNHVFLPSSDILGKVNLSISTNPNTEV